MKRLSGKRALITAAAQGIGEGIAQAFAREDCDTIATDVNTDLLSALDEVPGITTAGLDVLDPAAVTSIINEKGPFDILVNCAGFVHHGTIVDCTSEEWDFAFELNVKSMYHLCKAVIPGMQAGGGGSIINISSIAAHKGLVNRAVYGATKAAVDGLSKSIAADFVADGIRCNTIRPGTVQTPSLDQRINSHADPVAAREAFVARQPMGRVGTVDEVAAIAVYLGSDESVYTTGALMNVDGGMSI